MAFSKPLRYLDDADIRSLVETESEEGLTLEFKRELDLSQERQKKELLKDLSAFANAAGGRVFYGIEEGEQADGRKVAVGITPLPDPKIGDRVSDIAYGGIHPRPRIELRAVPVQAGFVLVVEVSAGLAGDVYMVTAYGENRFYKRGAKGVVPMSEPEIREAYVRVAQARGFLEETIRRLAQPELERRKEAQESILVIPWYSHANLLDQRELGHVGHELAGGVLQELDQSFANEMHPLSVTYDGYRLSGPDRGLDVAILRSGVVHVSYDGAYVEREGSGPCAFWSTPAIARVLLTLLVASRMHDKAGYWGPVRVLYELRTKAPCGLDPRGPWSDAVIPAGSYAAEESEVYLTQTKGDWGLIVKDIMDRIFQASGRPACSHFTAEGVLVGPAAAALGRYGDYLRIEASPAR